MGENEAIRFLEYCVKTEVILIIVVFSPVTKSPLDVLAALSESSFCPVPKETYLSVYIWIKALVLKSWLLDKCFRGFCEHLTQILSPYLP